MEAVVNKAKTFAEADQWDVQQQVRITPNERMRIAKALKDRAFPKPHIDIREWHRAQ